MLRQRSLQLKGRHVTVMRDLNVARYYFKRTEEVFDIDQYALATSLSYFGAAYLLALTLGTHWGSLTIGLLLMCYAIFQERARQGRLTKHIQARVHREWSRTTSPKGPEETPEWLNKVIATGWKEMGGERMLVEQILEATNPQLADVVEWYDELESIQMEELRLGDHPPTITRLQFENSDVFGEFRINADVQLQAPDCRALIQMVAVVGRVRKKLPATITNLNLNVDFQLLVRLSSDNGLTLVGIKLEKGQGERALLGLDFALKTTKVVDKVLAGFNLGKLLNETIHDSLSWMTHPCMLLLPWFPAPDSGAPSFLAGSDMTASTADKPVGQLEIRVKAASNLPIADKWSKSSDPFVRFGVANSWPLRSFRTRMIKGELNPVFEYQESTQLRWNESESGVLTFEVLDHDEVGSDQSLGIVEVPIKKVAKQKDKQLKLEVRKQLREQDDKRKKADPSQPAWLAVSIRFYPTAISRRVPMLFSGRQELGSVRTGVLQLEVVSVRNLGHGNHKLYVKIDFGPDLEEKNQRGRRKRHSWRAGTKAASGSHSENYRPGVFINEYYRSHDVEPRKCVSAHRKAEGRSQVYWRDMPAVGSRAFHEMCVEDCDHSIRVSIMTPVRGADKCLGTLTAKTIPELLEMVRLWKPVDPGALAKTQAGQADLHKTMSHHEAKRHIKNGHCVNGEPAEAWLPLDRGSVQHIDRPKKHPQADSRSPSGTASGTGLYAAEQSSDEYEESDQSQQDLASSSQDGPLPEVRLAATFYACRVWTSQEQSVTPRGLSNDWSPAEKGTLCVELVGASDLVAADDNGLSDPFAVFTLGFAETKANRRSMRRSGNAQQRSTVKKETVNPHWGEQLLFKMEAACSAADCMLTVELFDQDIASKDDFLGSVTIDLAELFQDKWSDTEIVNKFVLEDPEERVAAFHTERRELATKAMQAKPPAERTDAEVNELDSRERFPYGRLHLKLTYHHELAQTSANWARTSSLSEMDSPRGSLRDHQ